MTSQENCSLANSNAVATHQPNTNTFFFLSFELQIDYTYSDH